METQMAGSISRLDGNMSQDAVFKDILAYKEVLAHIMKTCVVEYRDCTIPEIMSYIENEPEVGQSGVHPDETNPPRIHGLATESSSTTEARVVYDVGWENRLNHQHRSPRQVPSRIPAGKTGALLLWTDAVCPVWIRIYPVPL